MKEKLEEKNLFKSSDLSLIATAQLYGYQIETLDRSNQDKVIFAIKRDSQLENLIKAFWSRSLRVDPLAYFESLKNIKARIYQQ